VDLPPTLHAVFNLQNAASPSIEVAGLTIEAVPAEVSETRSKISLALEQSELGLVGTLQYAPDLISHDVPPIMLADLCRSLDELAAGS
jgi:hypothetical protein